MPGYPRIYTIYPDTPTINIMYSATPRAHTRCYLPGYLKLNTWHHVPGYPRVYVYHVPGYLQNVNYSRYPSTSQSSYLSEHTLESIVPLWCTNINNMQSRRESFRSTSLLPRGSKPAGVSPFFSCVPAQLQAI